MIKKFNLTKPEKYIGKDGVEKTVWKNIGELTEFTKQDGTISRIVEIPAIGLKANVFEQKPRENSQQTSAPVVAKPVDDDPVDPLDIPF